MSLWLTSRSIIVDHHYLTGAYDDPNGSHISIEVVSSKFEGRRAVQRQQLVYKVRETCEGRNAFIGAKREVPTFVCPSFFNRQYGKSCKDLCMQSIRWSAKHQQNFNYYLPSLDFLCSSHLLITVLFPVQAGSSFVLLILQMQMHSV